MTAKQKLHQSNLALWMARFNDQAASGLSVRVWCKRNNLSYHAYNYWKHLAKESYVDAIMPDIVPISTPVISPQMPTISIPETSSILPESRYHLPLFVPGTLFLFCGIRANKIKGLVWEGVRQSGVNTELMLY